MKQSYFTGVIIRKISFKTIDTRGCYALLAVQNRQLAHGFSVARGESANLYQQDCFECLSPYGK